jgi:xanthine/uracil permease
MTTDATTSWGLGSAPPAGVLWPAALQHVGIAAVTLVFPLLVVEATGADATTVTTYIALSMIALGVTTLLQAWGRRGIGSGFLLPGVFTAVYLPPSLLAAQMGGLSAVAGLTLVAGATQILLSFLVQRMRPYLPTELAGLVVLMIGLVLGLLGLRLMLGVGPGPRDPDHDLIAPFATLVAIVAVTAWGSKRWRPVAVLVGLGLGIGVHLLQAVLSGANQFQSPPLMVLPTWPLAMPSMPWALVPGVLVGALASLVRASGDILACQRANDPQWKRPDFGTIRAGVLADGLGTFCAGLIGVPGTNTYTASVGLSIATGVMARRVALAVGGLWIMLGLLPGAPALLLAVPRGVLGATLFFAAGFIVVAGMGIVVQRVLDARRTVAVGIAFVVGVSYDAAPQLFVTLPDTARLLLTSSLVVGLLAGLLLTVAFRAGATRTRQMAWRPADGSGALEGFAVEAGSAWGARADVVARLGGALEEAAALLGPAAAPGTAVAVTGRFDEFNIDIVLRWTGMSLRAHAADGLAIEEEPDLDAVASRLAALLLWRAADRVGETALAGGQWELRLHYDH